MVKKRHKVVEGIELVDPRKLRPHPRNYRDHPKEQLEHLVESIRTYGIYRNVVVAQDGTILAGHGVVAAALELEIGKIPINRLPLDPEDPRALRILVADNELAKRADQDDRILTDLLRDLHNSVGLLGTGYDNEILANLVFVTRDAGEIPDLNAAREWADAGLPEYQTETERIRLILVFDSEKEKRELIEQLGVTLAKTIGKTSTAWWPPRPRDDLAGEKFVIRESAGDETA